LDEGNFKDMAGRTTGLLVAALVAAVATPVLAQMGFSDGYSFLKAVRARDGATVENLISDPSSTVINTRGDDGQAALHIVVRGRDSTWLNYLLSPGARPDIQDGDGATPLIIATQIGWREGVEALLRHGANPNFSNGQGETPLMFAVRNNDLAMVRLLMANHADPNQTDNVQGYSAMDYAEQDRRAAAILQVLRRPARGAARVGN
jgi:ankyrin repeat protein